MFSQTNRGAGVLAKKVNKCNMISIEAVTVIVLNMLHININCYQIRKKHHLNNVDMVIQTTFKFNHNDIPIIKQVYLQYLIDIEYYTYRKYFDFQHSVVMIILSFLYDPCFLAKMKQKKLANKKSTTRIPLISLAA